MSLYAYVSNMPLDAVAPTGLTVTCPYSQLTGLLTCVDDEGDGWIQQRGGGASYVDY